MNRQGDLCHHQVMTQEGGCRALQPNRVHRLLRTAAVHVTGAWRTSQSAAAPCRAANRGPVCGVEQSIFLNLIYRLIDAQGFGECLTFFHEVVVNFITEDCPTVLGLHLSETFCQWTLALHGFLGLNHLDIWKFEFREQRQLVQTKQLALVWRHSIHPSGWVCKLRHATPDDQLTFLKPGPLKCCPTAQQ